MQKERLYIYDTTLRDGQQTQGVQFSIDEKMAITRSLDSLGVDYMRAVGQALILSIANCLNGQAKRKHFYGLWNDKENRPISGK